mmetsp:Transcript_12729/g.19198  ORF Transcript_12729/g.19198 Transcript_12729/m.19198 type:complete len:460 (-) Transcript_12729:358-1737(-)
MSEQAPPEAAEGREQISPLSIEEGDAKIDNAAARFAKKQKRRRCLSITAVVLISLSAAAALVGYYGDFGWTLFGASDSKYENSEGYVGENEEGAGDELANENAGIDVKRPKQFTKEDWLEFQKQHHPKLPDFSKLKHIDQNQNQNQNQPNMKHPSTPVPHGKGKQGHKAGGNGKGAHKNGEAHATSDMLDGEGKGGNNDNDEASSAVKQFDEIAPDLVYEVLEVLPHDHTSFTQGLTYYNGMLYESTGLWGQSKVRRLDPVTGNVLASVDVDSVYFGEGMTYNTVNNTLIQITWRQKTGFVYDPETLKVIKEFTYSTRKGEGWGITQDPNTKLLIVSDGSRFLHFWDPLTLEEKKRVEVKRKDGSAVPKLNELEFVHGRVFANIWYADEIVSIDPETGIVEESYDFSELWPKSERNTGSDVFNGISVTDVENELWVTGKKWANLYRIKIRLPGAEEWGR